MISTIYIKRYRAVFMGLPGGHPEESESLAECIRREVREETGLDIEDFKAFGFASQAPLEVTTYPNGDVIHTFALLVHARDWKGNLDQANDESLALQFFAVVSLPEMLPNERESLNLFLAYKKTGNFEIF